MHPLKDRSIIFALTIVNSLVELQSDLIEKAKDAWCGIVFMAWGFAMFWVSIFWMIALSLHWLINPFKKKV